MKYVVAGVELKRHPRYPGLYRGAKYPYLFVLDIDNGVMGLKFQHVGTEFTLGYSHEELSGTSEAELQRAWASVSGGIEHALREYIRSAQGWAQWAEETA
jgi:hypothetical protein